MPARDGTGPSGRGARTGRGIGNCNPAKVKISNIPNPGINQPFWWGGRLWKVLTSHLFRRERANRVNRK